MSLIGNLANIPNLMSTEPSIISNFVNLLGYGFKAHYAVLTDCKQNDKDTNKLDLTVLTLGHEVIITASTEDLKDGCIGIFEFKFKEQFENMNLADYAHQEAKRTNIQLSY